MKKKSAFFSYPLLLLAVVFLASCNDNNSRETDEYGAEYGAAAIELMEIVNDNPDLKSMLISSIEQAKEINPDRDTNPVQNLVALLPIGMATIGSVNFEENIAPGVQVEKGDMLGHFAFGGADFIVVG